MHAKEVEIQARAEALCTTRNGMRARRRDGGKGRDDDVAGDAGAILSNLSPASSRLISKRLYMRRSRAYASGGIAQLDPAGLNPRCSCGAFHPPASWKWLAADKGHCDSVRSSRKPIRVRMRRFTRPHSGASPRLTAQYIANSCTHPTWSPLPTRSACTRLARCPRSQVSRQPGPGSPTPRKCG